MVPVQILESALQTESVGILGVNPRDLLDSLLSYQLVIPISPHILLSPMHLPPINKLDGSEFQLKRVYKFDYFPPTLMAHYICTLVHLMTGDITLSFKPSVNATEPTFTVLGFGKVTMGNNGLHIQEDKCGLSIVLESNVKGSEHGSSFLKFSVFGSLADQARLLRLVTRQLHKVCVPLLRILFSNKVAYM